MKHILLFILFVYQKTISPDHGWVRGFFPYGFCRFYPSCSNYAATAIERGGALRGVIASMRRLVRCNPWNRGGFDQP